LNNIKSTNKYKRLLFILILIGPVIDQLNGLFIIGANEVSKITPGLVIRGFFVIPILSFYTFKAKNNLKFLILWLISILFIEILFHAILFGDVNIIVSVSKILKLVMLFLGLSMLIYLIEEKKIGISEKYLWQLILFYGILVAGSIVVVSLMGKGFTTYTWQSFSSKGLFQGQNDTSVVLIITVICSLYYVITYTKTYQYLKLFFVSSVFSLASIYLSTRAALIGVNLAQVLFYLHFLLLDKHIGTKKNIFLKIILVSIAAVIIYNIIQFWLSQNVQYTINKLYALFETGNLSRNRVPEGISQILNFNIIEQLFGVGFKKFALTENDIVDLYGMFGLMILIPFLIVILKYYLVILKKTLTNPKNLKMVVIFIAFSAYLLHGSIAGHVFMSASANNVFFILLFLIYNINKKKYQPNEKM